MFVQRRRPHLKPLLASAAVALAAAMPASAMAQTRATMREAPPPAPPAAAQRMPNIVLILAYDFGVEGVNAYGGEYFTPNIDRLAREGIRFDNAHAMPLCSPSRVRLMTGRENFRNYEAFGYLAPGQRTFANILKERGYATAIVGKWQLMGNGFDGRVGITPEAAGFDEYYLWQLKALDAKGSRYWGPTRVSGEGTRIHEEGFGPDFDAGYAVDFIRRHKDKPFFLYYPMVLVHNPFVPTPDTMNATGPKNRFSGMVSYMDKGVGAVMEALRQEGLAKNTIVIFTGDNGTNGQITSTRDGYEVRGGKGTPTINGTHVPLIAWAPGRIAAGGTTTALFDFEDMVPTVAEIAGASVDIKAIDGISQWPVMTGQKTAVRDWIFQHYAPAWVFQPTRFVFDAKYKLYGDGRFVAMDAISGVESEISGAALTVEASARKATLAKILASMHDGPLDPTRFPWCEGQASLNPKLPSTVAGCKRMPSGEE